MVSSNGVGVGLRTTSGKHLRKRDDFSPHNKDCAIFEKIQR
jgi:hypothetical protein